MSVANSICDAFLERKRLVLTCAFMLAFSGAASWLAMPRQEDPSMPNRFGFMVIVFPGADAEKVERLVVEPVEEELAQVSELELVETTARADVAVMRLELGDSVSGAAIGEAWDDVREAVAEAQRDFPDGVLTPDLQTEMMQDQESVVLAITGSMDPTVLRSGAERLKERLLRLNGVSKVKLAGDPGEQVTIELDEVTQERLALSAPALASRLAGRNQTIPGGAIQIGGRSLSVSPASEFASIDEIAATPVMLPSGAAVRLEDVAVVRYGPEEPATSIVRRQGEAAVVVGIVAEQGVNLVTLGKQIRRLVAET
ncbi:MAG: efflux RND transporter permease subunit, partial [Myxococcota bacterium]